MRKLSILAFILLASACQTAEKHTEKHAGKATLRAESPLLKLAHSVHKPQNETFAILISDVENIEQQLIVNTIMTTMEPSNLEWVDGGDAVYHAASGMICPNTLNGFTRISTNIFDSNPKGLDVSCGYGAKNNVLTFYVTHEVVLNPDQHLDTQFSIALRAMDDSMPTDSIVDNPAFPDEDNDIPCSIALDLDLDTYAMGLSPDAEIHTFLTLASVADWVVKIRATYPKEDSPHIGALSSTLLNASKELIPKGLLSKSTLRMKELNNETTGKEVDRSSKCLANFYDDY